VRKSCFPTVLSFLVLAITAANSQVSQKLNVVRGPVPDAMFYSTVFQHLVTLNQADQANPRLGAASQAFGAPGVSPSVHLVIVDRSGFSQAEATNLFSVAQKCLAEISPVDQQAKAVINEVRAHYPGGRILPGAQPPAPPEQLLSLQRSRDTIVLKYVDQLRKSLGDARFSTLDNSLRSNLGSKVGTLGLVNTHAH